MAQQNIMAVVDKYAPGLITIDGVEGIAAGESTTGEPCLRIYVLRLTEDLRCRLPATLGGYNVEIEESGGFKACGK